MVQARRSKILEQQGKAKEFESCQDQILGESTYADPQDQALYNECILSLCHKAALNAWEGSQKLGKIIDSYIRIKQGQRELFSDFFQD